MNGSTKVAVSVGVALLVLVSFLTVNLTYVHASESYGTVTRRFEVSQTTIDSGDVLDEYRSYKLTLDKNVYPVAFIMDNSSDGHVYAKIYLYNADTVTFSYLSGGTFTRVLSSDGEVVRKWEDISVTDYVPVSGDFVDPRGCPAPVFSGLPVYILSNEDASRMRPSEWNLIASKLSNGELEHYSGFEPWSDSNYYKRDSIYAPSTVKGPYVLSATMAYIEAGLTSSYKYEKWSGAPDYEYQIKFRIGDDTKNLAPDSYYTELWASVPVIDELTGEVISHRFVFINSYKTSELYKRDLYTIQNSTVEGHIVPEQSVDKGFHYEINDVWSTTFGKFISASSAGSYGGITVYLRNAIYSYGGSDTLSSLVSDYAYFNYNPKNTYLDAEGNYRKVVIDRPTDIHQHTGGTFDEKNPDNNDKKNDVVKDNNDSSTIIVTDNSSSGSGNGSGGNSGGMYIPSGKWNASQFAEWVNNGFGLLGDNGIITLVGKLFSWLPSDIFNLLMWGVFCGVIIAVIKLVF